LHQSENILYKCTDQLPNATIAAKHYTNL